jgi:hypothetical protein
VALHVSSGRWWNDLELPKEISPNIGKNLEGGEGGLFESTISIFTI